MAHLFSDRLIELIKAKKSIICVGLDPRINEKSSIPSCILKQANDDYNEAIWIFNKEIIDNTYEIVPVFKPQIAFYEKYAALDALKRTIDYIKEKGSLVILDAKRNDIGSTSAAYASAIFDKFEADAVTINGYFGIDGVAPFLKYISQGKGIIILLKTSNKSSGEFQDLFSISLESQSPDIIEIPNENIKNGILVRNYIQMARLMVKWANNEKIIDKKDQYGKNGYSSIAGVVGATYPSQLISVRSEAPKHFILIPGYGAQGGTASDILAGINNDGLGAIVSASRSINFAYQNSNYSEKYSEEEFGLAARDETKKMQNAINKELKKAGKCPY